MARNEEKAQSMLHRYLRSKRDEGRSERRRPYLATLCDDVDEAEKWHNQVLRDIRRRVEEIQNPGLEETRIRELNDGINKLLRERGHWERRIVALGGTDYRRIRRSEGKEDDFSKGVFQHSGYFYFGAARNLPGVKELIESERDAKHKAKSATEDENIAVLNRKANAFYYGDVIENESKLREEEAAAEKMIREKVCREWEEVEGHSTVDAAWDNSYLQFIGQKPEVSGESAMEALALERKKAEALEQLQGGLFGKR